MGRLMQTVDRCLALRSRQGKFSLSVFVLPFLAAIHGGTAFGTLLISADFQADPQNQTHNVPANYAGGQEPAAAAASSLFEAANVWNYLGVPGHTTISNGLTFASLLTSTGSTSSVSLVLSDPVTAWNSSLRTDNLRGDYIDLNQSNIPAPSPTLNWRFTGLKPNQAFELFIYNTEFVNLGLQTTMLIDLNGDGSLDDETAQSATGGGMLVSLVSGTSGEIRGRLGGAGTQTWAGFQLAEVVAVPEPATLPTFAVAMSLIAAWRRVRR